jgi:transposase InsO family protein
MDANLKLRPDKCILFTNTQKPAGFLEPILVDAPFRMVGIDIIGPLVPSAGNRYILVATDNFTKWVETRAISQRTGEETARFFLEQICCRHGAPEILLSDQGSNFPSALVTELVRSLGTKHYKTSSYHPQTNGLTERVNGILIQELRHYVDDNQLNWSQMLPLFTFMYNGSKQRSTKFSPFELLYNRQPVFPSDIGVIPLPQEFESLEGYYEFAKRKLNETKEQVLVAIQKAAAVNKENYDKVHRNLTFEVGDQCLIYKPYRKKGLSDKLLCRM